MSPSQPLRGVVPPVCTPLDASGEVDTASLARLVEHLVGGGVHGLFALGSSSEVAFLTDPQREVALRTVVEAAAGRVPVLAGAIDMTTPRVLAHAEAARKAGADALVATAPFYARTHPREIARHFRTVRDRVDLPLYAYDLPVSVHSKLSSALVRELAEDGTLAGLKDSSGDEGSLRRLIVELGGRDGRAEGPAPAFSILTGSELTVDAALLAGADGVVPGLGNVDPAGYVRLYDAVRAGELDRAVAEQERLVALFGLVDAGPESEMGRNSSAIGAFKHALRLLGVFTHGATAAPQIPLDETSVAHVERRLRAAGLLPVR
ncbi:MULTISPECIES: dihydrodipicolinate synthase family protein [Streptomyces]|uniref:Dihydrodipicolinate synthase family protein n=3 Tax=Streptomyces TaxID=1883 RepID=A0A8H9HM32_9ACTN|nr:MULTISPECIES: dihydrodipicolinate synthase family protein [Streptomyces]NEE39428.1 dihydrodipicolinate synthase family protein [Streptomyces sp. SID7982]NEE61593.1 dihydrodipicolinate synthase family protein [Streptomyces sp. SID8455]MDQ0297193.1 4-hydroxy-tetrahydrodipicolinate synthase [Streptomyces sp. DSM 41037]PJM82809.1 dihydrodipicolinate synthase family protein [Streptomyces sp. TSRI0384-2]QNE79989.1 dihydrodipicolinate synthase family protein [Streptomyces rutgersensis]